MLSTQQLLLLNNLMYMPTADTMRNITKAEGCWTVGDLMAKIDTSQFNYKKDHDYGCFMTGQDWKEIVEAVRADPVLMNVRIQETKITSPGKGVSTLFVEPSSNEAVVVFKGTEGGVEWRDNFAGGGPTDAADGVSTQCQEAALDTFHDYDLSGYDSVTVSGHSKGGNKAKYITVMDSSVDRCVSFDGQGFSDEFVEKYSDRIAVNQGKIQNHNVDNDYVNLLLNDIGESKFYKGWNYGEWKFAENHSPNTFFKTDEDGALTMEEGMRSPEMEALDGFLNSYLRSCSSEEKAARLKLVANVAEIFMNDDLSGEEKTKNLVHLLLQPESAEDAAGLLAYLTRYMQDNPELGERIKTVLGKFGIGGAAKIVDGIEHALNSELFDSLVSQFGGLGNLSAALVAGRLPDWLVNKLLDFLEDMLGVRLSKEELVQALKVLGYYSYEYKRLDFELKPAGDITVKDLYAGCVSLLCRPGEMRRLEESLRGLSASVDTLRNDVITVKSRLKGSLAALDPRVNLTVRKMSDQSHQLNQMADAVSVIIGMYSKTESDICANYP